MPRDLLYPTNSEIFGDNPISDALDSLLDAKIDRTEKGALNGVASLDANGYIFASQINIDFDALDGNPADTLVLKGADDTGTTNVTSTIVALVTEAVSKGIYRVLLPPGRFKVNPGLLIPDGMVLSGSGAKATELVWATGAKGVVGLTVQGGPGSGRVENLTLTGPASTDVLALLNVDPNCLDGFYGGDNVVLYNVIVQGFRSGIVVKGNHQKYQNVRSTNNYYGMYWDKGGSTFGDQSLSNCEIVGNRKASIGVNVGNQIDSCSFNSVHLGFAPVGIFRETEAGADYVRPGFITQCVFSDVAFESCGNGHIYDAAWVSESIRRDVCGNQFINGGSSFPVDGFDSNWRVSALDRNASVSVGNWFDNEVIGRTMFWQPGDLSVFNCYALYASEFKDRGPTFNNLITTALPFVNFSAIVHNTYLYGDRGERAKLIKVGGYRTIKRYEVVYAQGLGPEAVGVGSSDTGGSEIPMGVMLIASPINQYGIVAFEGRVRARITGPVAIRDILVGHPRLQGGTNDGTLITRVDNSRPVFGISFEAQTGEIIDAQNPPTTEVLLRLGVPLLADPVPTPTPQNVFVQLLRPTSPPVGSLWVEVDSAGKPTGHQEVYA